MSVVAGVVAPHPPLLLPAVGGVEVEKVRATVKAMERVAAAIAPKEPDVLVFISPHSPTMEDAFVLRTGPSARGSFARFGHPDINFDLRVDDELARAIADEAEGHGLAVRRTEDARDLDWGVLVPYHFIGGGRPIVSLSISGLDYRRHQAWGQAVYRAAHSLGRRIVFVASGDLSHKLTPESPYGYAPEGKTFENEVVAIFNSGKLSELADIDHGLVAEAAECGLRSFIALSGVLDGLEFHGGTLAHEGPFGVGYAVALFETSEESHV